MRAAAALTALVALGAAFTVRAAAPAPAAAVRPEVAAVMSRLRVQEAPRPVRESPRWQPPRKVLLLAFGALNWNGRLQGIQAAVPGARVVAAPDLASARAEAADADVIVGFNPDICDAGLLGAAKSLRWVQSLAAGVELCLPVPAFHQPGLLVTNLRGVDAPAISEHAIAMLMALAHGLDGFARDNARAQWRGPAASLPLQMLEGKTLLVVGLGSIGTEVARRGAALGMRVIATDAGDAPKPAFVEHVGRPAELLTLAREADAVISCVPLTPQTTGLYDARFFASLKPSAWFLNVARGPSVVTDALVAALNEKRLAGAGLDVTDPEPLPPDHPLWKAPRVLITPHISTRTDLPGDARWLLLEENLRRYAAGGRMLQVVDVQRGY